MSRYHWLRVRVCKMYTHVCVCILGIVFPAQDVLFSRVCRTNHTPQQSREREKESEERENW